VRARNQRGAGAGRGAACDECVKSIQSQRTQSKGSKSFPL
jgi:hypothetical protein